MKHIRWSDNDRHFGPFTYSKDRKGYRPIAAVLGSGDCEDSSGCSIRLSAFGHTLISTLPQIIMPYRTKVIASSWDAATVARMGRDWYWDYTEREYGFSYCRGGGVGNGGFLQVFFGRQSNDGRTEQRWGCFTPWNNWRHVRRSLYGLNGEHIWTEPEVQWRLLNTQQNIEKHREIWDSEKACPTRTFSFKDFDGEELTAKTRIEERQWELGTGWFKLLQYFKKPIIYRSLDIEFSGETGKRKGSWKGGTIGHSIEMLPGELHESAFRRYCAEHEMTFKGEV